MRNQQAEDRKRQLQLDQQRKAEMDRQAQLRKQQQDAQNLANQKRSQEEARINNLFKDMTIYDALSAQQNPGFSNTTLPQWYGPPSRVYLGAVNPKTNFENDSSDPKGIFSNRYGIIPNQKFAQLNPKPQTISLQQLRNYHKFKKGGLINY